MFAMAKLREKADSKYEGDMANGKKNGQGTLYYPDGGKYEGQWVDNLRSGYGVNTWANGNQYRGNWKNNKKHGNGKLFYANKGKYIGEWRNDMRHGEGESTWPNGNRYIGSWVNNKQHGQGTFIYADGGKYEGEWADNLREGYGVNSWPNGDRYEGLWSNNRKHGKGTLYHADGTKDVGIWANDVLNGHLFDGLIKKRAKINDDNNSNNDSKEGIKFKGFWIDGQPSLVVLMPKKPSRCLYLELAHEFAASLNWDKIFFDPNHDNCYCSHCYWELWDDVIRAGEGRYVIPRGWARLGLRIDEVHMTTHDIWNKWIVTFHGTTKIAARSIISHRQFCLPGDVLIDGTELGICKGHIPNKKYIYTSPTIAYSSDLAYSPIYDFHSTENNSDYETQIVLQCRQMPGTYEIGPETIGAGKRQICPHIPNSEIEYFTDRRASLLPYGLVVRLKPKHV